MASVTLPFKQNVLGGRDEELFNTPVDEEHIIQADGYKTGQKTSQSR